MDVTHLEDHRHLVAEIEGGDLHVGRVAAVVPGEPTSQALHRYGVFGVAQRPAYQVHLVGSLIAHVAIASIPIPVPVVVHVGSHDRQVCSGAQPELIVQTLRGHDWLGCATDAVTIAIAQPAHGSDLAEVACVDPRERLEQPLVRSILETGADDRAMPVHSLDHLTTFPHAVAHWLFDVHVFARLAGLDRHQCVPVVGSGNDHDVDILVLE